MKYMGDFADNSTIQIMFTTHAAAGRQGGKDGATHEYRILKPDGGARVLKTKEEGIPVEARSVFDVRSGGGGGWGAPSDRDADARSTDSQEELPPLASGGSV